MDLQDRIYAIVASFDSIDDCEYAIQREALGAYIIQQIGAIIGGPREYQQNFDGIQYLIDKKAPLPWIIRYNTLTLVYRRAVNKIRNQLSHLSKKNKPITSVSYNWLKCFRHQLPEVFPENESWEKYPEPFLADNESKWVKMFFDIEDLQ